MATQVRFQDLRVDHVRYYVADLDARIAELEGQYGFEVYAESADDEQRSAAIGKDDIRLVLTEGLVDDHPTVVYVAQHDEGIGDIALGTPDAAADFREAERRGARPLAEPVERDGVITATIGGFGDITHTFVQRVSGVDRRHLAGFAPRGGSHQVDATGLLAVDHFAVCLEADQLEPTAEFYQRVLDFDITFTEKIIVGDQAMSSTVVQSRSREVTLTLIEPDTSRAPGQIDRFLKNHGGPGVQHVAFTSLNIVGSVATLRSNGVEFLTTPAAYFRLLADRLELSRYTAEDLGELGILADEDHAGQLFQIFTRSTHPRGTLFFEVIERLGATTFGSGNIRALYEAIEAEQAG